MKLARPGGERPEAPRPLAPPPTSPRGRALRLALLRRRVAAQVAAKAAAASAKAAATGPTKASAAVPAAHLDRVHPILWLLLAFAAGGLVAAADIVLVLPPESGPDELAFLIASGVAVWGIVGIIVYLSRRGQAARQAGLLAYDAVRQGLLVAGCLELNLATRMVDLWSPLVGGLLVAVFAVFEVVTLGRRPG